MAGVFDRHFDGAHYFSVCLPAPVQPGSESIQLCSGFSPGIIRAARICNNNDHSEIVFRAYTPDYYTGYIHNIPHNYDLLCNNICPVSP